MKTKLFFTLLLVTGLFTSVWLQAQNYEPHVKLTHNVKDNNVEELFSLEGGVMKTYKNKVEFIYEGKPEQNRTYKFSSISNIQFIKHDPTSVKTVEGSNLFAFIDNNNQLQLQYDKPLGRVMVWSVAGLLLTDRECRETTATLQLPQGSRGVFLVRIDGRTIKLVR